MGSFHIGTQGWSYPDWVGPFYPPGSSSSRFLTYYAKAFSAVEIDSSFYAVPPASNFLSWHERTPADFRFALKLPGELTHERRLKGGFDVLRTFCMRAELLEEKLGPILIQLPPDFTPAERPAFEAFVDKLPQDLKFAVEFRDMGWLDRGVWEYLRSAGLALALCDGPWLDRERVLDFARRPTADFSYFRWQGANPHQRDHTIVRADRSEDIAGWAELLEGLQDQVKEIYGFFNNHYEGHSPKSARRLLRQLGEPVVEPEEMDPQLSLF